MKEKKALSAAQLAWYSKVCDHTGRLRWNLAELIEEIETHNRWVISMNRLLKNRGESPLPLAVPTRKLKAAKRTQASADKFFSGK